MSRGYIEDKARRIVAEHDVPIQLARSLAEVLTARKPRCDHPSIDIDSGCCVKCGDSGEENP